MNAIERLDFTGPPPGLSLDPSGWALLDREAVWAQYRAEHDPPGMYVDGTAWGLLEEVDSVPGGVDENRAQSRCAAWAWYWRRVKLADAYQPAVSQGLGHLVPTWPSVLGWTDEQVAAAEACLIDDEAAG